MTQSLNDSMTQSSPTHARWTILSFVFLISVVTVVDRVNISVAAQYLMPEYGLSQVQMGTIFSAFIVGYTLSFIPGGWLGDRFGPRRVLTGALLAAGICVFVHPERPLGVPVSSTPSLENTLPAPFDKQEERAG